jgi:CRP-like cAMP-binding protein
MRDGDRGTVRGVSASPISELPWLGGLRDDERERVASRFRRVTLATGERHATDAADPPMLGIVLSGRVAFTRDVPGGDSSSVRLRPGDRWGELAVFGNLPGQTTIEAETPAEVALLDRDAFAAIAAELPIVWLAVAQRLSREVKATSDVLREIRAVETSESGRDSLARFLDAQRRIVGRRAGIARAATRDLFRQFVGAHVREPAFWVLVGFVAAIAVSRLVVAFILHFGLQERLFALGDSGGANPTHMHHFNYGFAVLAVAGLLTFFPRSRRMLRTLGAAFGVGLGLVFDEFALIWHLDPDYYQPLSYWAQAILAATLIQVVYLRRVYGELATRLLMRLGGRA